MVLQKAAHKHCVREKQNTYHSKRSAQRPQTNTCVLMFVSQSDSATSTRCHGRRVTPPQVLNVMPIWCDADVHLGGIAVAADLGSRLTTTAGQSSSARLIEFRGRTDILCRDRRRVSEGHKQIHDTWKRCTRKQGGAAFRN